MIKTPYRTVYEAFDSSIEDPDITVSTAIDDAKEDYQEVPDEFVEYKYQDKLNDIRKDIDYFKSRLDEAESNEAKEKYMKLISELVDEEKTLLGITTTSQKHELDKQNYVGAKVAQSQL